MLVTKILKCSVGNFKALWMPRSCFFRSSSSLVISSAVLRTRIRIQELEGVKHILIILKRHFAEGKFPPHTVVKLPSLSPTMEMGNLQQWTKNEGDKVAEGDELALIETDKATMSLDSPEEGFLAKIFVPAGTKNVKVGTPICVLTPEKGDVAALGKMTAADASDDVTVKTVQMPSVPADEPTAPVQKGPSASPPKPPSQEPPTPPPAAPPQRDKDQPPQQPPQEQADPPGKRPFASPLAKSFAKDQNIKLSGKGSGVHDSIKKSDLKPKAPESGEAPAKPKAQQPHKQPPTPQTPTPQPPAPQPPAPQPPAQQPPHQQERYRDLPITNMRKAIAAKVIHSKQVAPHFYITQEINVTEMEKLRKILNTELIKEGPKISLNDMIVKAAAVACQIVPAVNSSWMDTFIREYMHADISVAVNTPHGVMTPIIFNAQEKTVREISVILKVLAAKAREGKLKPYEFQGGTFTVSNLGMYGTKHFAAIINSPQSCILSVGASEDKLLITDRKKGTVAVTRVLYATLSCDHRVVDGVAAAEWLRALKEVMERTEEMFR